LLWPAHAWRGRHDGQHLTRPPSVGHACRTTPFGRHQKQRSPVAAAEHAGEAAAIDFFGPSYGLPKAICAHQNYFLWGPREYTGEIMILVGSAEIENARPHFASVEAVATLKNPYAMPHESRPILLARGLKVDLHSVWATLKNWD